MADCILWNPYDQSFRKIDATLGFSMPILDGFRGSRLANDAPDGQDGNKLDWEELREK